MKNYGTVFRPENPVHNLDELSARLLVDAVLTAPTLTQLCDALNALTQLLATTFDLFAPYNVTIVSALREACGNISDLPTYGGTEPTETWGVWSWDPDNLLVNRSNGGFEITPRSEYEGQ